MSTKNSNRVIAGVSLERHVVAYLDDLAIRMGLSRSWVLNTIVYEYAKFIENKELTPLMGTPRSYGSKDVVIRA